MNKVIALLALIGSFAFAFPVLSQDKANDEDVLSFFKTKPLPEGDYTWRVFSYEEDIASSFHVRRVRWLSEDVVEVWVKERAVFDVEGTRREYIERRRKAGLSVIGFEKYDHSVSLEQFDCNRKRHRFVSVTDYDSDGQVLESLDVDGDWSEDIPDSLGEYKLNKLCAIVRKDRPKKVSPRANAVQRKRKHVTKKSG